MAFLSSFLASVFLALYFSSFPEASSFENAIHSNGTKPFSFSSDSSGYAGNGNQIKGFRNQKLDSRFDHIKVVKAAKLPPSKMNKAMRDTYLYFHNQARQDVYRYYPLRWSDSLASLAQDWATRMANLACPLAPVQNKFGSQITFRPTNFGENQFYTWYLNGFDIYNSTAINNFWIKQQYSYNYKFNSCSKKQYCGNYLQIIWKPAKAFGCGIQECPLVYAKGWTFKMVVCNYDDQFYYDTLPY